MFRSKVNRYDFAKIIHSKFNGQIDIKTVNSMITNILVWMREQFLQNKPVTIEGFGTFSLFRYLVPEFFDIYSKKIEPAKIKTTIRFNANTYLKQLLKNKKEYFNERE